MQRQPTGAPSTKVILIRARILNLHNALRPVLLGILVAGLASAALANNVVAIKLAQQNVALTVVWATPLLCSFAMAWRRTLWVDVTAQGILLRRLLAAERVYPADAIVLWGFEHESGRWSTLPPAPDTARRARFVLETTDGFRLDANVRAREAEQVASLLLRHPSQRASHAR